MDEGSERDKTWGRGSTYAARSLPQYNSAFATRVLLSTYACGELLAGSLKVFLEGSGVLNC
jgi:hypothetical protein